MEQTNIQERWNQRNLRWTLFLALVIVFNAGSTINGHGPWGELYSLVLAGVGVLLQCCTSLWLSRRIQYIRVIAGAL